MRRTALAAAPRDWPRSTHPHPPAGPWAWSAASLTTIRWGHDLFDRRRPSATTCCGSSSPRRSSSFFTQKSARASACATGQEQGLSPRPRAIRHPMGRVHGHGHARSQLGDDHRGICRHWSSSASWESPSRSARSSPPSRCSFRRAFAARAVRVRGSRPWYSIAYVVSALLAKPDWGTAATHLVIPALGSSPAYWLAVVGTVGTRSRLGRVSSVIASRASTATT